MEEFKRRYTAKFIIERVGLSIDYCLDDIGKSEHLLHNDYAIDSSEIPSDEFVKIILIDCCFLSEFLLRLNKKEYEEIDRMSHKKWKNILSDLLLMENQVPYHVLRKLLRVQDFEGLMKGLLKDFFRETFPYYDKIDFDTNLGCHLLDSVWNLIKPQKARPRIAINNDGSKTLSLPSCPTISELHRAGVKFRRISNSRSHFDIRFRRGVLEIPPLNIDDNTSGLFANLMALELCKGRDCYVTDYVAMIDYLIDRPKDVQLLVRNGIVENFVKDEEVASSLINELGMNIDVRPDFYYSDLVEDLNAYCKKSWIKWKSTFLFEWKMDLKRNYFSNPWKALSVIAAIILLGLTIIQTVCSIVQLI